MQQSKEICFCTSVWLSKKTKDIVIINHDELNM